LQYCYEHAVRSVVPSVRTRELIWQYAEKEYPIDVIHNGVDLPRFKKQVDVQSVKKKYEGKKILLTVGGLWGRKGQDFVIRALPEILKKHPDTVYCIVGKGSTLEDLTKLAEELGVRDSVDFAGPKSGDELVAYFKACDIYVHTPRITGLKFEGFGIVYIEAGACGKPSVATDAGGIRDAVVDGETGLVVPADDVSGIANAVSTLLSDDSLRERMGKAAEDYASKHDWMIIGKQFVDLYNSL
jgi:phosphatidylinositol alpha-1,6-mannosyltransferase